MVEKYAAKRADLKKQMINSSLSMEEREVAAKKFHAFTT